MTFQDGSDFACDVVLSDGDRLINFAADIARRRGDGHRLYDSILISVIREMNGEQIREAIGK